MKTAIMIMLMVLKTMSSHSKQNVRDLSYVNTGTPQFRLMRCVLSRGTPAIAPRRTVVAVMVDMQCWAKPILAFDIAEVQEMVPVV